MKKNKVTQIFDPQRLFKDKELSKTEIAQFISEFQEVIHGRDEGKRKLISLRVPQNLLNQFKAKAEITNTPYQRQILKLMREWLKGR